MYYKTIKKKHENVLTQKDNELVCYNRDEGYMKHIQLREQLGNMMDPTLQMKLDEVDGIHAFSIDENDIVHLTIKLKQVDNDQLKLKLEIIKLVKIEFGYPGIKLSFIENTYKNPNKKEIRYIAIASGKGGVGKSTVTAQLAYAFNSLGHRVGIMDADIYGASIPSILHIEDETIQENEHGKLLPLSQDGIEVISTDFFMSKEKPIMWRGPMLGKMITEFVQSIQWHQDTSYILIDLPPGTGDVALDIQKLIPQASMIIVTTPHPNASMVAVKAGLGARQIGHTILGVIENMSYFIHPTTLETFPIFGSGGGEVVSTMLGVPLLEQVPIYFGESFIDKEGNIFKQYQKIIKHIEAHYV